jgi:hypothetical protein
MSGSATVAWAWLETISTCTNLYEPVPSQLQRRLAALHGFKVTRLHRGDVNGRTLGFPFSLVSRDEAGTEDGVAGYAGGAPNKLYAFEGGVTSLQSYMVAGEKLKSEI